MTVEELFRDDKNQRNGFCLRRTKITKAEQLDRLLLILAPAYWLLAGIGMVARQRFRPGRWCSSNRENECGVFTIGRIMFDQMQLTAAMSVTAVIDAVGEASEKWG